MGRGGTTYSQVILLDVIIQVCKHGSESFSGLANSPARQGNGELDPEEKRGQVLGNLSAEMPTPTPAISESQALLLPFGRWGAVPGWGVGR